VGTKRPAESVCVPVHLQVHRVLAEDAAFTRKGEVFQLDPAALDCLQYPEAAYPHILASVMLTRLGQNQVHVCHDWGKIMPRGRALSTGEKLLILLLLTGRVMQAKFCLDVVCVVCQTKYSLFALRNASAL
jgi:hypothetical protein